MAQVVKKLTNDPSFTEISVDRIVCHKRILIKLCIDHKLWTYLAQPRIPYLMKPPIWYIHFGDALCQEKLRLNWILPILLP